jgi:hypothetical protein
MKMVPWVVACKEVIFPSSLIRKEKTKGNVEKHGCVSSHGICPSKKEMHVTP